MLLPHIVRLLGQLSDSPVEVTSATLRTALAAHTYLHIAENIGGIVGMASLVVSNPVKGLVGHVEDVAVDAHLRGQGVGFALMTALHETAMSLGLRSVDLTSRPSREEANRLYVKLGYELRATNVYRFRL